MFLKAGQSTRKSFKVYEWNSTSQNYVQLGEDITRSSAYPSHFGIELSMNNSGNKVFVASNAYGGTISSYNWTGSTWEQVGQHIEIPTTFGGQGVDSLKTNGEGDIIAFGSIHHQSGGGVRIYQLINNEWTQMGNTLIRKKTNEQFGRSVSLNEQGNIIAIGALVNNNVSVTGAGCGYLTGVARGLSMGWGNLESHGW